MDADQIRRSTREVLGSLPAGVELVAAAKTRAVEEVRAAVEAGVGIIGHNYVREAERMARSLGPGLKWHMIGHLQRNKVRKAVGLFNMIETMDSFPLAEAIERHAAGAGKSMDVLVEVNSAGELSKTGVAPGNVEDLVRRAAALPHLRVRGLMTMGPFSDDPEESRPAFRLAKGLFDRLAAADIPGADVGILSMGMSSSYEVAVREGATMVRVGTRLFGARRARA